MVMLAVVGLLTVGRIGITWDEPNYFTSSYSYLSWVGHIFIEPSEWWSSIDRYWAQSHEAPPFFKLWAGLFAGIGALLFGTDNLALLGDVYRLGSYALFLISVFVAFRFVRREFGVAEAWGAALSLSLVPVLFGFARLGQLDGAAAAMYLLAMLAIYGMIVYGGWGRTLLAGALLGLAFATKLTVFPLVPAAVLWVLVNRRGRAALVKLLVSFGIGAVVFFGIWPWLWRDPIGRTWEFLTWAGGLEDERLTYYLGQWWAGAPWHYPLVALLALVPLVVAVAGLIGVARLLVESRNPAAGWLIINLALIVAVAGSGLVPIYGGPRQFLTAFPIWAVCAGVGIGWLATLVRRRTGVVLALYVALALPGILWTGMANSLEYYGEGVGLIPGARTLGFETTYLANTYKPAVEYVNEVAPEGATIYVQAGTYAVMETYRRIGDLREDLRPAYLAPISPEKYTRDQRPREDSYFLFLPRQSIYTEQMLALEKKKPVYAEVKGDTPLVKVYAGDEVAETLDIKGSPPFHDVGWLNALIVSIGMMGLLGLLWRRVA
ncbi:hypothetical protein BH23ACT11_BH23ACT11_14260 [soil metagenome]